MPSDQHRSGELTFNALRTSNAGVGGLGLASFLLGDVSNGTGVAFARYVSTSTEARERQWRHFYYAQDTWRANPKLTLNYGLRLDVINPQTVNEAGNGTWVDLDTGLGLVGGVGGIDLGGNVENRLNWAPRLGATYQLNDKTVIRGGYGRSYDIGVFGSLFGHTVTQNLPVLAGAEHDRPEPVRVGLQPGAGAAGAEHGAAQRGWHVRVAGRHQAARRAAQAASARGGRLEHHRPASAERHGVGGRSPTSATTAATCSPATTRTRT